MAIPTKIEQTSRTVHTASSGIEIIRTFDVEPYEAHVEVLRHLRGFVENGKRTAPAFDPYIKNCYCVEAVADQDHPDSMVSSETIDVPEDIPQALAKKHHPLAGAKITAHYRPLVTAVEGPDDEGHSKWDWLDVKVTPGLRQIPWPQGLYTTIDGFLGVGPDNLPTSVGQPYAVVVTDISVRRILVPEVPWDSLDACANCTNSQLFPALKIVGPMFPRARPGTLKFTGFKVENMLDSDGNRWYELTLHFERISHWTPYLMDALGRPEPGWITWDHVFYKPSWGQTGWYPVWLSADKKLKVIGNVPNLLDVFAPQGGPLHNRVDFRPLFKLDP